jgi:DNA-binding response OmpR family regulator
VIAGSRRASGGAAHGEDQPAMKVMLVEDEAMIAMIMEDLLAELDCEVVGPFGAVANALDWLSSAAEMPDAAVLDVNLGGERVFPVAEALRARGVPFAFATGYGAIDDHRFMGEAVLRKPLDFDKLADVVAVFRAA